jgi:hypothetical protein
MHPGERLTDRPRAFYLSSPVIVFIARSVPVNAVFAVSLTTWIAVFGVSAVSVTVVSTTLVVPFTADCAVSVTVFTVSVPRLPDEAFVLHSAAYTPPAQTNTAAITANAINFMLPPFLLPCDLIHLPEYDARSY